MSNSTTYLALANFKSVIEAISPTDTAARTKFAWYDSVRLDADQSAGMTRAFNVRFLERDGIGDGNVSDAVTYNAVSEWLVEVAYSTQYELLERQRIMLNDAKDLIKALRDDRNYEGVLDARQFVSDEIVTEAQTAYLRQRYRCAILEVE